jgi:DNA polymerase I-like protein with 3'-5' exonuclease and polymerase domains/uracil-DNA glycosylase
MSEITTDIACTRSLPVHCVDCGLHRAADSWCLSEDVDSRTLEELSDAPTILVVAPPPRKQDDKIGRIMTGPPGDFLREFLAHLDCKWVIMPATRCYAGKNDVDGLDIIPTSRQLDYCASNYLPYIASTYSPSVIVCLGYHALRAVMGDDCPATINAALKSSFRPDHLGGKTWVLATYDPVNHTSGRKDLRDDYFKVFLKAEELARRDYVTEVPFSYLAYEDSTSALRKLDEFIDRESVYFDVEVSQCDLDPDKKTMWHPGSRLLSCSLTFPYHTQESASGHGIAYDTIVLHGDALNATVIRKAIANKYVVAHNLKYDANALYRFLDVCVFTEAKGYKDTIFDFYLRDQAKMGNSLKQLAEDMLGAVKWDSKIWDHIDSRNNEIRRQMAAANRANGKIIRNIRKVIDKLPEGPKKASWIKMLENPPTEIRDGFSYITIPMHPFQGKLPPFTPVPLQNADFGDVPLADLLSYNARDTYWDARLGEEVIPRFAEAERANPDTVDFLLRSSYALARIERKGLPFDKKRMLALRAATAAKIEQLTSLLLKQPEVHEALRLMQEGSKNPPALITPDMLNVKSFIFYEALIRSTEAPTPEKTPSGRLSSSKDVLKELAGINPLVEDKDKTRRHWIFTYFLALRQARDMISKFINSYIGYLVKDELGMDRIHTDFRLTRVEGAGRGSGADDMEGGAGTGRLSSSPNVQNLPGNEAFKSCIIAPPGKLFLECDFSTGEPVILAHVAGIQKWKEVFEEGIDLYKYISTQIPFLQCPTLESVTPEVRKEIKTETLAIMYDEQAVSFARRTGIPELHAIEFFKQFTSAFPEIDAWKQAVKASVARGEILTTLFGRKRSFQLKGDHGFDNGVLRQAINFPIQSSLSDITLWKLYEIFQWIDSWDVADKIHPVNTVHDSIWFEVDHKEGLELVQAIAEIMQDMTTLPFKMEIPLRISFKIGRDLGHMKEYKTWEGLADAWDKA